jgi:outer membrane lipoprotein-sorting protein
MRRHWVKVMALLLPALTGCLSHTRKLQAPKGPSVELTADAEQLESQVNRDYDAIHSMNATVDFRASVGGQKRGSVTDYNVSIRGFILLRKPDDLRVLGLVPVLHTTAFDLASDGKTFKLLIPPKNKAIEGSNTVTKRSSNTLENLRPGVFFDAMMIHGISPDEKIFLTTETKTTQDPKTRQMIEEPHYDLYTVRAKPDGNELIPERVIHFSRATLRPVEQDIYNADGNVETQVLYGPDSIFGSVKFPGTVTIKRPIDEYEIFLTIEKLTMNQPLSDDQFENKIPPGIQIQHLD